MYLQLDKEEIVCLSQRLCMTVKPLTVSTDGEDYK